MMPKLRRLAALSLLAAVVFQPGLAAADFGALAFSQSDRASASSYSQPTRGRAEAAAQSACEEYGDDCRIVLWFRNSCGAVAAGENGGYGTAWRKSRREAEAAAINACRNRDSACRVVRWACSG